MAGLDSQRGSQPMGTPCEDFGVDAKSPACRSYWILACTIFVHTTGACVYLVKIKEVGHGTTADDHMDLPSGLLLSS